MKYILMHKRIEVAKLSIDEIQGGISSVDKLYNPEHLPFGVFENESANRKELNNWWRGRSIPASRNGLHEMLDKLGESDIMPLVLKSYGLSLSDHYWVRPGGLHMNGLTKMMRYVFLKILKMF